MLQLVEHHLGLLVFVLKAVLKSGDLLALSLELQLLLVCLGNSPALKAVLHFQVDFVHLALFSQNVLNLFVRVLLLTFEVLNP